MPPAMRGLDNFPPQAGRQDLALKHCSKEAGLELPSRQLQGGHKCAEKPRGQSPKMSFIHLLPSAARGSSQHLRPQAPSAEPHFWHRNKASSLCCRGRCCAWQERLRSRGSPGSCRGREFPAGRRGHPHLPPHRHGVPPRCQRSPGQGRGLRARAELPHGQGLATLSGPWGRGTAKGPRPG